MKIIDESISRIFIDEDVCLAHYLCVHEAPLIFYEKDKCWEVKVRDVSNEILNKEKNNIFSATSICPVSAINIEFKNGMVINGDSDEIQK